ncbi:ferredoxin [Phytohabitans kaempferiae]|uniref:Ferredoxin n=1 Tax=Phytohabitans kaempferiae TaxID=1620943 RepID=A0ABV6M5W2_9ACTN
MKIKLDRTICDGFGLCAVHAPETFSVDEWGYVSLAGAGNVAPEHERGVRRALLDCPVHAITELQPVEDAPRELTR